MKSFLQLMAWIRHVEANLAAILLGVIVSTVLISSVTRTFGIPLIWSEEVAQGLFVWLAMLASDLTWQRAGHFRVDLLTMLLPKPVQRVLELVILMMIGALLFAFVYYGLDLIRVSHPRPLPMLNIPSSFVAAALPVACLLMLLTTVEHFVRQLRGDVKTQSVAREVM